MCFQLLKRAWLSLLLVLLLLYGANYCQSSCQKMFQSTSSVDENDWLLDSSSRRRERNWTVTFCSFFFCLLYAVALATILGSIGYFGIVQHSVSNWDGLGSAKRPCILHSEYEDNHFVIGDNIYCVLTFGGESVLALACLVLLSISLFQVLCGRW